MNKLKIFQRLILIAAFISAAFYANADVVTPVKWEKSIKKIDASTYEIAFKAKIDKGWHLYGLNIPDGGPIATSFNFESNDTYSLEGKTEYSIKPEKKYDSTFEMELELYGGSVTFLQKVKIKGSPTLIKGYIEFMACDDSRCLPPVEEEFVFEISDATKTTAADNQSKTKALPIFQTKKPDKSNDKKDENTKVDVSIDHDTTNTEEQQNIIKSENLPVNANAKESENKTEEDMPLWMIFLYAILGGLAAIITPCVYPIIPLTVSFFSSGSKSKINTITKALGFGISLILIYTVLGFLSGLFQIDLMKVITSNWISNLIFFILFVVFAASFFGAFEITLPNKWANAIDQKADKGGLIGAFFMALATAVVSFSCTGLIAGVVLGYALQGDVLTPTVGMFGFGLGFALPFTILAFFPNLQKKLPKSGGWLNTVKVVFAFVMLLFSLIFLGLFGMNFIPRDLILAIAVSILILQGMYLIGKLKFSHDSDLPYVSVPRILLAILSWTLAIYLFTGIFGAPLKKISPFLPPKHTLGIQFTSTTTQINANKLCSSSPKHSDKLHLPEGLKGYFDWNEALACAKQNNMPVLVDFVGHYCKNCKKMYAEVWSDQSVKNLLSNKFIILALYTDDNTKLPEDEWITSTVDDRIKNTIGKKNADFQVTRFNSNALPMYVIVDPQGNIITKSQKYYTYSNNIKDFIDFLNEGISEFNKTKN